MPRFTRQKPKPHLFSPLLERENRQDALGMLIVACSRMFTTSAVFPIAGRPPQQIRIARLKYRAWHVEIMQPLEPHSRRI